MLWGYLVLLGVHPQDFFLPGDEPFVPWVGSVELEHVPPRNFRFIAVPRVDAPDVDTVSAPGNFFHERIDPDIVLITKRTAIGIHEHLAKTSAHRVSADLVADLVDERVTDHGSVEIVGGIKNPIRVLRHVQWGDILVFIIFVPCFQSERFLGAVLRAVPTDLYADACFQGWCIGQAGSPVLPSRFVDHHVASLVAKEGSSGYIGIREDVAVLEILHHHHRQVGGKIMQIAGKF